ncbi:MAG: DUF2948 family protein [Pseudomonadota bacterium]
MNDGRTPDPKDGAETGPQEAAQTGLKSGEDARFEEAPFSDRPLRLRAETVADLEVLSTLTQDAVGKIAEVMFLPTKRRFVILLNRFRWEDADRAIHDRRPYERVRSALTVDDVLGVRARGVERKNREAVVSLLSLSFAPAPDAPAPEDTEGALDEAPGAGAGTLTITCAGETAFALEVETLSASLTDLTRPWQAQAGQPDHPDTP